MIKPSAETLWARRRLAQDPRFAHLFRPFPLLGVPELSSRQAEPWNQTPAEVVEIFPGAQVAVSITLDARRTRGRRPA